MILLNILNYLNKTSLIKYMSLEDEFHENKLNIGKTLIARFKVNNFEWENLLNNLNSKKMEEVLANISKEINLYPLLTVEDLSYNDIISTSIHKKTNELELHMDHRYVGGPNLLRVIECITNTKPKELPKTNIKIGYLSVLYSWYKMFKIYNNPIYENNSDNRVHLCKSFIVERSEFVSRQIWAYYNVFNDALSALNKKSIRIGLSVVFDNSEIINNVGLIVFDFTYLTSPLMLNNLIKQNIHMAIATNAISVTGKELSKYININSKQLRQCLDIICTTFITDNYSIPGKFSIEPICQIYEGAYISLYCRLLNDNLRAEIHTAVTTSNINQKWKKLNYIVRKSN